MNPPVPSIAWADSARQTAFNAWLADVSARHPLAPASVRPASSDASFRRYFRVDAVPGQQPASFIVMDAPPSHEDCRPFVKVSRLLEGGGLNVPRVLEWDEAQGFLLLTDLGADTYLSRLDPAAGQSVANNALYRAALSALVQIQQVPAQDAVPPYDAALLRRELDLFPDWYLARHKQIELNDTQRADLEKAFALILDNNLAQPRVLVHRDYHSRNLMVSQAADGAPGVLDFQDAVFGPITYDLVSLLRDAYIEWDEPVQIDYAVRYWEAARKAGLPVHADFSEFWRDFEWMGLQRQLKVLGIFARLAYRDGKRGYLDDIPRVWRYAHRTCTRYQGLGPLARLLEAAEGATRQAGYTF